MRPPDTTILLLLSAAIGAYVLACSCLLCQRIRAGLLGIGHVCFAAGWLWWALAIELPIPRERP